MNTELVSVIIPTYKRPEKLADAVQSVLAQDYQSIEVIVVDDNNPDDEPPKLNFQNDNIIFLTKIIENDIKSSKNKN